MGGGYTTHEGDEQVYNRKAKATVPSVEVSDTPVAIKKMLPEFFGCARLGFCRSYHGIVIVDIRSRKINVTHIRKSGVIK